MSTLARLVGAAARLLAPPECAACGLWLEPRDGVLCGGCAPLLEPPPPAQRAPARAATAFLYGGPLADAIRRLKYGARPDLARGLGALLAEAGSPFAGRVDRVVPVPLHRQRLRERGYNQSALLAAPLARCLGAPLDTTALCRTRATTAQASLPRGARRANVRGAFAATRPLGGRVLLVDDVRTSGATLAAAALALRAAGPCEVRTLVLAWAEP